MSEKIDEDNLLDSKVSKFNEKLKLKVKQEIEILKEKLEKQEKELANLTNEVNEIDKNIMKMQQQKRTFKLEEEFKNIDDFLVSYQKEETSNFVMLDKCQKLVQNIIEPSKQFSLDHNIEPSENLKCSMQQLEYVLSRQYKSKLVSIMQKKQMKD